MSTSADVTLEDGELSSSNDEATPGDNSDSHFLGCEDYVVPERPLSLTKAILQQSTTGISNSKIFEHEEESDNSSSSSSSDSEDDKYSKKRRMVDKSSHDLKTDSRKPGTSTATVNSSAFQEAAQKFQSTLPKKINNIWADVIHDEQAAQMINQLGVHNKCTIERGSESYVLEVRQRKRTRADSESSEISSGGLSDNAKEYLRTYVGQDDSSHCNVDDTSGLGLEMRSDDDIAFTENGGEHRSRSKKRKRRRERQSHKQRMVKKLSKMDDKEFANYLIYTLCEPKQALIFRIVSVLGRQTTERLFLKTLKIQRRGGLYIRNQQRLRTPGGVLLYLIRGDKKISEELVNDVFKLEKQQFNKMKKKQIDKKRRRLRFELRKQQLEYQKSLNDGGEGSVDRPSYGDNDEYLNSSDEAKIEMDDDNEEASPDDDCLDLHCDPSDLIP